MQLPFMSSNSDNTSKPLLDELQDVYDLIFIRALQVFLTQIFSGTGAAEHLAPFLIPQYIIMFVSMTALTAYTLQALF